MSNFNEITGQITTPLNRIQLARVYKTLKDKNSPAAEFLKQIVDNTDLFTIVAGEDKFVSKEEIEKLAKLHGDGSNPELTKEDLDAALKFQSLTPPPPLEQPKTQTPPTPQKTK